VGTFVKFTWLCLGSRRDIGSAAPTLSIKNKVASLDDPGDRCLGIFQMINQFSDGHHEPIIPIGESISGESIPLKKIH
jgi:hypothetical protein